MEFLNSLILVPIITSVIGIMFSFFSNDLYIKRIISYSMLKSIVIGLIFSLTFLYFNDFNYLIFSINELSFILYLIIFIFSIFLVVESIIYIYILDKSYSDYSFFKISTMDIFDFLIIYYISTFLSNIIFLSISSFKFLNFFLMTIFVFELFIIFTFNIIYSIYFEKSLLIKIIKKNVFFFCLYVFCCYIFEYNSRLDLFFISFNMFNIIIFIHLILIGKIKTYNKKINYEYFINYKSLRLVAFKFLLYTVLIIIFSNIIGIKLSYFKEDVLVMNINSEQQKFLILPKNTNVELKYTDKKIEGLDENFSYERGIYEFEMVSGSKFIIKKGTILKTSSLSSNNIVFYNNENSKEKEGIEKFEFKFKSTGNTNIVLKEDLDVILINGGNIVFRDEKLNNYFAFVAIIFYITLIVEVIKFNVFKSKYLLI